MDDRPYLTLVIPAYNEQDNIPPLLQRVEAALRDLGRPFEVILVDDGSTDQTPGRLLEGMNHFPWLRVLRLARNSGQSAAFDAGFKAARGEIVATLDADLQNDPQEIPRLLSMMNGYDMITGWRQARHDTMARKIQTRIANAVRNRISGESIHDSACSLKLYRRHCLQGLQMFNGMHRFMPTLIKMRGGRVLEIPVSHAPRHAGKSKYGLSNRALRGLVDLLAVRWMKKRWLRYDVEEVGSAEAGPTERHS